MSTKYESCATAQDDSLTIGTGGAYADVGQTFTPSTSHSMTSFKFNLLRATGMDGTLTLNIYATSGGVSTGGVIATGTASANVGAGYKLVEITLNTPLNVAATTMYAARLSTNAGNSIAVGCASVGNYSGGTSLMDNTILAAAYDCEFEEYGNPLSTAQVSNVPKLLATGIM